jgi:hypothetical protein
MKPIGGQPFTIRIIFIGFFFSLCMIVITTPLHEAAHWVMSDIDPYIEPVEFHLFDDTSFQHGEHILSSALGCVVVKEKYPGAFQDRGSWADVIQEIICAFLQMVITCVVVLKVLTIITYRYQKEVRSISVA